MTEPKQSFTEFWIIPDSTQLLNNRKHVVYDKEQHDELYFNDGEAYDDYFKPKAIHVIEHSALVAERARRIAAEGERDMAHTTIGEKALEWAQTYTFNVQLQQEIATLRAQNERQQSVILKIRKVLTGDIHGNENLLDVAAELKWKLSKAVGQRNEYIRHYVSAFDVVYSVDEDTKIDIERCDLELQKKGQGDE